MNKDLIYEQQQFLSRFLGKPEYFNEWKEYPKLQVIEYLFNVTFISDVMWETFYELSTGTITPKLAWERLYNRLNTDDVQKSDDEQLITVIEKIAKKLTLLEEKIDRLSEIIEQKPTYPIIPWNPTPNPVYPIDPLYPTPPYYPTSPYYPISPYYTTITCKGLQINGDGSIISSDTSIKPFK